MSVVERALKKLQGSSPQKGPSATGESPVAKAVDDPTVAIPNIDTEGTGRFHIASRLVIGFDLDALAEAGLLAPGNERLADEYRGIKRPIVRKAAKSLTDAASAAGSDRLVMVTSSLPGEGKTFTSVNLSLSLAQERDWSVLLIDTDCRNPSLSRLLGVTDEPGLLDFLSGTNKPLEQFVLPTNIDRLYILPLGKADPHAAELLASDRMQDALAAIVTGEFGDIIAVFDSSPLLLTPEPAIIGTHVGQIVMVVRANETARSAVAEALGKLDAEKSIGLVLNGASPDDRHAAGYSYPYSQSGDATAATASVPAGNASQA